MEYKSRDLRPSELDAMTLGELAEAYYEEWCSQEKAQHVADEHSKRRDTLKGAIIRSMNAQGMESFKTDKITLTVKEEMQPQVKDWLKVLPWIAEGKRWEFVRKQLNSGPFREMLERGDPLPDGLEAVPVLILNNRRK